MLDSRRLTCRFAAIKEAVGRTWEADDTFSLFKAFFQVRFLEDVPLVVIPSGASSSLSFPEGKREEDPSVAALSEAVLVEERIEARRVEY
jgi:hypothetical protein